MSVSAHRGCVLIFRYGRMLLLLRRVRAAPLPLGRLGRLRGLEAVATEGAASSRGKREAAASGRTHVRQLLLGALEEVAGRAADDGQAESSSLGAGKEKYVDHAWDTVGAKKLQASLTTKIKSKCMQLSIVRKVLVHNVHAKLYLLLQYYSTYYLPKVSFKSSSDPRATFKVSCYASYRLVKIARYVQNDELCLILQNG